MPAEGSDSITPTTRSFFLAGDDGDAAGHHGVELGVDVFFFGDFVGGESAALGVAQSDFFAN